MLLISQRYTALLVYYQLVFINAAYHCHHCCFLNVENTHWCSIDNSFFSFESGCHCRFHDHGDEAAEQRVYNGAYTDELCKKKKVSDTKLLGWSSNDPLLIMMLPLSNLDFLCCLIF